MKNQNLGTFMGKEASLYKRIVPPFFIEASSLVDKVEVNPRQWLRPLVWVAFWNINPIGLLTGKPLSMVTKRALVLSYRNLNRNVPLAEAAEYAGVSPSQLERKLHEEMGLGFHGWHAGERIELAKARMAVYIDSPTEAMIEAGFSDYAEFSRTFKAYTKLSPHAFYEKTWKEQDLLERVRLKRRMTKWKELSRLLLLIHEGRVTEKRLMKVRELRQVVNTWVSIQPIGEKLQGVKFLFNSILR